MLPSNRDNALAELIELSQAMMGEGRALIERVLPAPPATYTQWEHYPKGDAIDPDSKARWFYHAHPPEQRGENEHGHFHIFLPLSAFKGVEPQFKPVPPTAPKTKGKGKGKGKAKEAPTKMAEVVHVAALCFDLDGLPTHWIATNQWVTNEYLYPAEEIIPRLDQLDLSNAGVSKDIDHVGRWLTCALAVARSDVEALLHERDAALAKTTPRNRAHEILATAAFDV